MARKIILRILRLIILGILFILGNLFVIVPKVSYFTFQVTD